MLLQKREQMLQYLPYLVQAMILEKCTNCNNVESLLKIFDKFPYMCSILNFHKNKFLIRVPYEVQKRLGLFCCCRGSFLPRLSLLDCNIPNIVLNDTENVAYCKTFLIQETTLWLVLKKYKTLQKQIIDCKPLSEDGKNEKRKGVFELCYNSGGLWQVIGFYPYCNLNNETVSEYKLNSLIPTRYDKSVKFYWTIRPLNFEQLW